jgi:putative flippase GtrA
VIIGGCPTRIQAWVLLVPVLAYTAAALWLFRHPNRISNDWSLVVKRLFALGMIAIGFVFTFLAIYTAFTGKCPGFDPK